MTIDRRAFLAAVTARREAIVEATRRLIAAPSPNPPLDCRAAAASVAQALIREAVPGIAIEVIETGDGIVNLVAVLKGRRPGRRVVLSGHLDTYPVLEDLPWTVDPLGGEVRDGRIYGRGACDMKGGIAASIAAFAVLAEHRAHWSGEVVLALSGDEESMGERGAKWLLENRPETRGDATLIADVGSPDVLRFGEKGFLWFEIEAQGKPAHGAHVHLGENAIERLMTALQAVFGLRELPFAAPPAITAAIAKAAPISEVLAGAGESATLNAVTVNIGQIEGGISPNLIPATARARGDIRLPVGVTCAAGRGLPARRAGPAARHRLAHHAAHRAGLHRSRARARPPRRGRGDRGARQGAGGEHARRRLTTTMRSALRMVASRCAMTSVVRPARQLRQRLLDGRSVSVSSAEVASSRIRIGGFFRKMRAMARRCFWPPESLTPRSPIIVSSPAGSRRSPRRDARGGQPRMIGLAGAEPAIGDVLADRAGEQEDVLLHDADLPAQRRQRHVADVDAVDGDAPASTS
jgi:succinyl-diaminopimelate desuccinylase